MKAAYARQSVEKKNSISIEGQIELCENTASPFTRIVVIPAKTPTARGFKSC